MDPLSLSAIGAQALGLGIQFLYSQAGEVLKRWREHRDGGQPEPVLAPSPAGTEAIATAPQAASIDFAALDRLEGEIRGLRSALGEYAEGIEPTDPTNVDLLEVTDALRCSLERVLGEDLTFKGEERQVATLDVTASMDLDAVAGYAVNVLADATTQGRIRSRVRAKTVLPGGEILGVDLTGGDAERPGPDAPDS